MKLPLVPANARHGVGVSPTTLTRQSTRFGRGVVHDGRGAQAPARAPLGARANASAERTWSGHDREIDRRARSGRLPRSRVSARFVDIHGRRRQELLRLHDAGIIRVMDIVIIAKAEDGTVMAQELGDLGEMDELSRLETDARRNACRRRRRAFRGAHEARHGRRRARLREPVGRAVRVRGSAQRRCRWSPTAESRCSRSSPPSRRTRK